MFEMTLVESLVKGIRDTAGGEPMLWHALHDAASDAGGTSDDVLAVLRDFAEMSRDKGKGAYLAVAASGPIDIAGKVAFLLPLAYDLRLAFGYSPLVNALAEAVESIRKKREKSVKSI